MKTIQINSSHGHLIVDAKTGKVVRFHEDAPNDPGSYLHDVKRVDVTEYRKYYKTDDIPEQVDILDFGMWFKDGKYEGPELEWRKEFRKPYN